MPVATLANAQSIGRTRAFLTIFIPLVGLLAGLLGFVYLVEVRTETRIFEQTEQKVVDSLEAVAMGVVAEVVSDVMFLADHHALNEFLNGDTSQRHALEQDYLAFSRRKRIYDQIRYLDETGMEVVRVNFNGGNPKPVPTERLQNKGKHYYFAQVVREVLGDLETRIEELNGTVKAGVPAYRRCGSHANAPAVPEPDRQRAQVSQTRHSANRFRQRTHRGRRHD